MLRLKRFFTLLAVASLATVFMAGSALAAEKMVPKVDNFILYLDYSGSMAMTHKTMNKVKIVMAKDLLKKMVPAIPDLDYQGGFYTFAPYGAVTPMAKFQKSAVAAGVEKIKTNYEIFNRITPMGDDMLGLDKVLAGLKGKTAIIMLTDGDSNYGIDPVAEAKALASKYNVCFHVISYADSDNGKAINEAIKKINACTCVTEAKALDNKAAMDDFIKCALYDMVQDKPAAPAPAKETPDRIVFRGLQFDFNKADIKPQYVPILQEAASILKQNPSISIVVEGHTDSVGTEAYNQKLSERRANSVKEWLVKSGGIDSGRITTVGYGKSNPKFDNKTDEGRAMNRRVELRVK